VKLQKAIFIEFYIKYKGWLTGYILTLHFSLMGNFVYVYTFSS